MLFEWRDRMISTHPELWLLNGSINGVKLSMGLAVKCKRIGMGRGCPDIHLPVARQGYHSLYIELKRIKKSTTSKDQIIWSKLLRDMGNRVEICKGWHEAKDVLINYLTIKNPSR